MAIGGANRDPEVFEQPDEFRIDSPDPGWDLLFPLGLHHCLGAALARLEGRIAIEELTRRYPALELAAPPTRRSLLVLRGFESVPVRAAQIAIEVRRLAESTLHQHRKGQRRSRAKRGAAR